MRVSSIESFFQLSNAEKKSPKFKGSHHPLNKVMHIRLFMHLMCAGVESPNVCLFYNFQLDSKNISCTHWTFRSYYILSCRFTWVQYQLNREHHLQNVVRDQFTFAIMLVVKSAALWTILNNILKDQIKDMGFIFINNLYLWIEQH